MAKCGNCITGHHDLCTGWVSPFDACDCTHVITPTSHKPIGGIVYNP
jgi:hypothetical protein